MIELPGRAILEWALSNALPLVIGMVAGALLGRVAGALFGF